MTGRGLVSALWFSAICMLSGCGSAEKVTVISLLGEMSNRESLTYFPEQQFRHRQFSSYNRESVSPAAPGWYANYDMSHFLRVEQNAGRREFVMMDADGPGAVVRWWMTFYKARDGILRVYVDNDSLPVIQGSPRDMLSGSLIAPPPLAVSVQEGAPLGEEGRDYDYNFYVPLPFAKHLKITYECDSLEMRYENEGTPVPQGYWWPDVFYNIGYRAYDPDVKVESVTLTSLRNARSLMEETAGKLTEKTVRSSYNMAFGRKLSPGDSLVVQVNEEDHAINRLRLKLSAPDISQALRSTVITASFDGIQTVWTPSGELFGAGYILKQHRTWMNAVLADSTMESYWVMPFRERFTLTFINYGTDSIIIDGSAGIIPYRWKDSGMYFGASWHEYYNIRSRDVNGSPFDLNFVGIEGKGVYAGDQITLFNGNWNWWGEGDEKIFVDGESFPSSFGTGSEDYYGYSFGRQEPFSHPFLSQPEGTGNMATGPVINMRIRSLDAIPFRTSVNSNIELWHWADTRMNYALTTFFYIRPPFTTNIIPDIESVKRRVVLSKIDFTLEEK